MATLMEYDITPPSWPDHDDPDYWLTTIKKIKNDVIGSNKQKKSAMKMMIVQRLLQFMESNLSPSDLKIESAIVLGSLAKGPVDIVQDLVEAKVIPVLLKGTFDANQAYVEACLRCLRTIMLTAKDLPEIIYQDPMIVPHFINILQKSFTTEETITNIFASCCNTEEHQNILHRNGIVIPVVFLMATNTYRVQMPALRCLSAICYRSYDVSTSVLKCVVSAESVIDILARLQDRDKTTEMQICAAKCLTYIYRSGAVDSANDFISHKTLPTLVRMCKSDNTWEERVEGAETLAYLIDVDVRLQNIAAISDHMITTLAEYFKYPGSPPDEALMPTKKDDIVVGNELRQSAFRAYASLCANSETVRHKVIETDSIMQQIVNGLTDPVTKVQIAAIRCLHSLSRSVQQLRTSFHDHNVWKSITKTLHMSTDEAVLCVTSAVISNLLIEFSPCKEHILNECEVVDDGSGMVERKSVIIDKLLNLTRSDNNSIKLNAIWALMNMTFKASQELKEKILKCLKNDDLFHLVTCADPSAHICMKTLATLRNLLATEPSHADLVMLSHGPQIMETVILILEGGNNVDVKEQALCILTNIADGTASKHFIMDNADVLRKIMNYLTADNVMLQIASACCIFNLIRNSHGGYEERQEKLKEMGLLQLLKDLHEELKCTNKCSVLSDKITAALKEMGYPGEESATASVS